HRWPARGKVCPEDHHHQNNRERHKHDGPPALLAPFQPEEKSQRDHRKRSGFAKQKMLRLVRSRSHIGGARLDKSRPWPPGMKSSWAELIETLRRRTTCKRPPASRSAP